jgi:predicted transcriptional regulator
MGTPHQGSSGAELGRVLTNFASLFMKTSDRILNHLKGDSEYLQMLQQQYGQISDDLVTKFAYEEYKTPIALRQELLVRRLFCTDDT